jgi:hypothetical protein
MNSLTPRYYKVFISSTFQELAVHRQHAIQGILNAGHMPVALENFTPENESKRRVIEDALASCQFYVIILGSRYGSIPKDQEQLPPELRNKSYTEIELEMACAAKLPILAFYMDSDEVSRARATKEWSSSNDEPKNIDKYESLRKRLTEGIEKPLAKPYTIPGSIYTELYAYFQRIHPDVRGYILEPESGSDMDVILRFSSGSGVARDIVEALSQFRDLDPRLAIALLKKQSLASAFFDLHGDDIERRFSSVFFESGSTITYLARILADKLPKRGKVLHAADPLSVLTNNAFAYLYLWLTARVMCHPVPEGPPDHIYGGMYGALTDRKRRPDYKLPPLESYDRDGADLITQLMEEIFTPQIREKSSLLLASASGLQLSEKVHALERANSSIEDEEEWILSTNAENQKLVCQCRGFHVGSYQNMLFKRCYYLSGIPTVVFIHDSKVDCDVKIGKCHYLFDVGFPWVDFAAKYPLSLWIGCEQATYKSIIDKCERHFTNGEWSFVTYDEYNACPIVIGHNKVFRDFCSKIGVRVHGS